MTNEISDAVRAMLSGGEYFTQSDLIMDCDNIRVYKKNGIFAVCEEGIEPGDIDALITTSSKVAAKWVYELE